MHFKDTTFGDVRSAVALRDREALWRALHGYQGNPEEVLHYVQSSWGYIPAEVWYQGNPARPGVGLLASLSSIDESQPLSGYVVVGGVSPFGGLSSQHYLLWHCDDPSLELNRVTAQYRRELVQHCSDYASDYAGESMKQALEAYEAALSVGTLDLQPLMQCFSGKDYSSYLRELWQPSVRPILWGWLNRFSTLSWVDFSAQIEKTILMGEFATKY